MRTRIHSVLCSVFLATVSISAAGQGRLSPHDGVSATIDGANLSIMYGRPSMRGRRIMGALVPYGRVW